MITIPQTKEKGLVALYYKSLCELKNSSYYEKYETITKDLSNVLNSVSNKLSTQVGIFTYLLEHGYLSDQHKYRYDEEKQIILPPFLQGMAVISGTGVCRNEASLAMDVFPYFSMKVFTRYSSCKKDDNLNEIWLFLAKFYQNAYRGGMNHVMNYFFSMKEEFLFDFTNKTFFQCLNKNTLESFDQTIHLPIFFFYFNNCYIELKDEFYHPIKKEKRQEIIKNYKEGISFCMENKDYFEAFYETHKDDYEEIAKKLEKERHKQKILKIW